jgi:hypothetical protein
MSRRFQGSRPPFDPAAPVEQARLFSAVSDLARAGLSEPLEAALERIDQCAVDLGRDDDLTSAAQLSQIRAACDELAASLSTEQRRVMQDIAELQGQIRQRRRYAGAPDAAPGLDRRG